MVAHSYFDGEKIESQLQTFSMAEAQCYCCSVNHTRGDGEVFSCDRDIMQRCIQLWFGSIEEFEKSVQTRVKDSLSYHLGMMFLPYPLMVVSSLPLMWAEVDLAISALPSDDVVGVLGKAIIGIIGPFVFKPAAVAIIVLVIRLTRGCCKVLRKRLAIAVLICGQLVLQVSLQFCVQSTGLLIGELIWAGTWLLPCMLIWWCANKALLESSRHSVT